MAGDRGKNIGGKDFGGVAQFGGIEGLRLFVLTPLGGTRVHCRATLPGGLAEEARHSYRVSARLQLICIPKFKLVMYITHRFDFSNIISYIIY